MIQVEYWSDYVCPFCYIGSVRLNRAISEFGADPVEIVMHSFELDPFAPVTVKQTAAEHFANKYHLTSEAGRAQVEKISETGRAEGITDMDYANTRSTNTLDAHRLTKYALQEEGKDIRELLDQAFFCEHLNIGERSVLLALADRAGLPAERTVGVLDSREYEAEVRRDERQAKLMDIHTIPHFIVAGKTRIDSSGSVQELKAALQSALR